MSRSLTFHPIREVFPDQCASQLVTVEPGKVAEISVQQGVPQ
jgi:hypothetical protein